ncbi:hypothetical protein [Endozoicomonas sp.]|uniref:hypothetical protein n=1 Tax=Endozoicomonas sp. TaxID=1892382 RepID=UPI00383A75D5
MTMTPDEPGMDSFWTPEIIIANIGLGTLCTLAGGLYLWGIGHGINNGKQGKAALIHPFKLLYSAFKGQLPLRSEHVYQKIGTPLTVPLPPLPPRTVMTSGGASTSSVDPECRINPPACQAISDYPASTETVVCPITPGALPSPKYYQLEPETTKRTHDHPSIVYDDRQRNVPTFSGQVLADRTTSKTNHPRADLSPQDQHIPESDETELSAYRASTSANHMQPTTHYPLHDHQPHVSTISKIFDDTIDKMEELQETSI